MSRTEMARNSARDQTKSNVASLKATEQTQRDLAMKLDRLAMDLSTISQRFDGSLAETEQTLESATERAEAVLTKALASIRLSVKEASSLPEQVSRFRLLALMLAALAGASISMLLLIVLLIWQPQIIQALWTASQAIR